MSNNLEVKEQKLVSDQEQVMLIVAARLLSYPPASMDELKQDIDECIEEEMFDGVKKKELKKVNNHLFRYTSKMLREIYVSTFDLKEKLSLYLTAHEYGDSPNRGGALITLQKIIKELGYERVNDELADYIPMLLELLAVAPESVEHMQLHKRLAISIHRILAHIEEGNPYVGILRLLSVHVFPKPTEKEIAEVENNREEADLEELPYPMMYQ